MKRLLLAVLLLLPLAGFARENAHDVWAHAIADFEAADRANPPAPGAVLFVGSSSIQFWKSLAQDFPGVRTLNRGFGGSDLDDSTYYADRIVIPYKPRAIVVYAGDNDIMGGDSPAQVRDDFIAFVTRVRKALPNVPIAFVAIKPSIAREALMPKMHEADLLIAKYAASQHGITYLDVYTPMLDAKGQPRPELFIGDGLHMNHTGYEIWIGIIAPWIKSLPSAS
jgi:lysophospholipase L1-like esterase